MAPVMSQLLERPTNLQIIPTERFPTTRKLGEKAEATEIAEFQQFVALIKNMAQAQLFAQQ